MELPDNPSTYLVIAGIGLAILELILGAATAFELLVIGIIFVVGGFIGLITNSFLIALLSITLLSFLYFFGGRNMIRNTFSIETKATNVDAIIGEKAVVVKKITPDEAGQVKVQGEIWRATAKTPLEKGQSVTIDSVSGVTLSVSA